MLTGHVLTGAPLTGSGLLAPVATPNPLVATILEGVAWGANNSVTVDDPNLNSFTVTLTGGTKPVWVNDDFDDTGSTSYPTGTTLGFSGTPPLPASQGVFSWTYDLSDGLTTRVLTVNLTVTDVFVSSAISLGEGIRNSIGLRIRTGRIQ